VDSLLFSRAVFIFLSFSNIFNFSDFCRICYFKFLNSVLTNNLEMNSSFFLKYFKKIQNFKNFIFDRSVFKKPISPVFMKISRF
jgi:hypothetical protein